MVVSRLVGLAIVALALCAAAPSPKAVALPTTVTATGAANASAPPHAQGDTTPSAQPVPEQALLSERKGAAQTPEPAAENEKWSPRDYALVFAPITTAIVALIAVWSARITADAQRRRDANQDEIEKIETLIRTFHVPYLVRSEANHNLARDIRSRQKDRDYRMLVSLFDPDWRTSLSVGDQRLVEEVCATGLKLGVFIEENAGGVDERLTEHLARAYTHFRILHLAYEHKLGSDPTPFQAYVYPRQLDAAIKTDLDRLVKRRDLLRGQPSKDHGQMPSLVLRGEAILPAWLGAPVPQSELPASH